MADPVPNPIIGSKRLNPSGGSDGDGSDSPPHKLRRDETSAASEKGETKDTATSNIVLEEPLNVDVEGLHLLEEMIKFHSRYKRFPFSDESHMAQFIYPWIHMGNGNANGWLKKFREIRDKFKNTNHVDPTHRIAAKEFDLWSKIYRKQERRDDDRNQAGPSGCS